MLVLLSVSLCRRAEAFSLSVPATHAFTVAALEYFGGIFNEIRITSNQTDTYRANCTALALAAAREHYHAIIGTTTSDCALEVARIAAQHPRLPFVGPGSYVPALSRPDRFPTSFRMSPSAEYLGVLLAVLLAKLGFPCAVLLTDETSIDFQAARDGFTRAALERGVVLFGIMGFSDVSGGESFVDALLDKLWSLGTGVIVVNL
jgi:ABC-type branched-subunit amino acid transport system substrate-binding protein